MIKPLRVACILEQAAYKPGDQAPEGYLAWHEWAEVQNNLATALVWIAQVRGEGSVAELEDAERSFNNVLEVTGPETAPAEAGVVLYNIGAVQERIGDRLSGADQIARYRQASATYAQALDALRRGGRFSYASDVKRCVSPFMNRIAQVD